MTQIEDKILNAVKENVETIETARYNSEDPIIKIEKNDSQEMVIIKVLTSEQTGTVLNFQGEQVNTAEKIAERNFRNGVRTLNSWQFRNSSKFLIDAANLARDPQLQQRINLYKQLTNLLKAVIRTNPERIIRSKGLFFDEIIELLKKYDTFSPEEQNHYRKLIDSLYGVGCDLEKNDLKALTQQLFVRCSMALYSQEYLAAYIWLYRIYLLVKTQFDAFVSKEEVLKEALTNLQLFIEIETGLKQDEDSPIIASAFDLQTIFADYLSKIFDVNYEKEVSEKFSFPLFRE